MNFIVTAPVHAHTDSRGTPLLCLKKLFPNRVNMMRPRLRLSWAVLLETPCLRLIAPALLREAAEVVPVSDPRAQLRRTRR
jgi:hypothetical protein